MKSNFINGTLVINGHSYEVSVESFESFEFTPDGYIPDTRVYCSMERSESVRYLKNSLKDMKIHI